jgi:sugar O-acyltransferase (sialic acid O-acetyltransferase NeuD family)
MMSDNATDLLILGSGPHALEMFDIAKRANGARASWNVAAFVVADTATPLEPPDGLPVLSLTNALVQYPAARIVAEFEWPRKHELPRDRLATLIDPSVFVATSAHIGLGCVIYPHCYIGSNARIGDFLFCLAGTVVNHNDIIEDEVTLTSGVVLAGDVHVEANCYLGQGCTVRELLTIGRGTQIGMGAVVLHDVPPNSVMVGNPARRLRARQATNPIVRMARRVKRKVRRSAPVLLRRVRALPFTRSGTGPSPV